MRLLKPILFHLHLQRAFTLIELLVAIAIIGSVAAIAVPSYSEYVERADVVQAIADIQRLDVAMATFETINNGRLPDSLAEVGLGNLLDPWGNPYQYLEPTQKQ